MKMLWCWRCQMEVPMLDEDEYKKAHELYGSAFKPQKDISHADRFKPLLEFHYKLTGFESIPNAIMHHRIAQYGPSCESCGKPYRTPKASFCAACGHKRDPKDIST